MKIERTSIIDGVEAKRLNVPFKVTSDCPTCGEPCVKDLSHHDHLSYPSIGTPMDLNFYCDECEGEWSKNIILDFTLKAAP